MQVESIFDIKSRPVYSPVALNDNSSFQLFIYESKVSAQLENLYESCCAAAKERHCAATLADDMDDFLERRLSTAPLNSTIYIAGSEPFIWTIVNKVKALGLLEEQIRMIKPEANERRVYCVHCFSVTPNVTSTPATCIGCQRKLLVSDHFSRLHCAYMGDQINAEDPADVPIAQELT
jgi:hypothetical protein